MQIELVFEKTCPNIEPAREQLRRACKQAGLPLQWQEWEVNDANAPAHVHGYGSPTILINGRDVSGTPEQGHDMCCRVYAHSEGTNKGVPALNDIVQAIQNSQG